MSIQERFQLQGQSLTSPIPFPGYAASNSTYRTELFERERETHTKEQKHYGEV
jgi:hypothetical protein